MKSSKLENFQIVVIGPQGSGKGTQAKILEEKLGFALISLGDLLRKKAKDNPSFAQRMEKGELLSDEEVFSVVVAELSKLKNQGKKNIIFDGMPRTVSQFKELKKRLPDLGFSKKLLFIFLELEDGVTIERISKRRVCKNCEKIFYPKDSEYKSGRCSCSGELITREDDKEEAVKKRLKLFHDKTEKIFDNLLPEDALIKIDGKPKIEVVTNSILKELNNFND